MNCLKVFGDAIDLDSFFCNCRFPFEKRFTTSWPPSLFEIYSLASEITLPTVSPILSKYHENPAFPNLHRIDRSRLHLASGQAQRHLDHDRRSGIRGLAVSRNPILKTPHLDQLHSQSVRFTDFHASPFCTPTRAALMTGNHPGVTGISNQRGKNDAASIRKNRSRPIC